MLSISLGIAPLCATFFYNKYEDLNLDSIFKKLNDNKSSLDLLSFSKKKEKIIKNYRKKKIYIKV